VVSTMLRMMVRAPMLLIGSLIMRSSPAPGWRLAAGGVAVVMGVVSG